MSPGATATPTTPNRRSRKWTPVRPPHTPNDAEGHRLRKDSGSSPSTEYVYFGDDIVAEKNVSTGAWTNYIFFDGHRVARQDASGVAYYFSDHLKTATVITDSAGNIKSESDYYPWGGELPFLANDPNHYKFTGKERDVETQLDYFGARYYGSSLGRFTSPDPHNEGAVATEPQSWNAYSYAANNPLRYIDPDGQDYHFCFYGECQDISDRQYENWLRIWQKNVIVTASGDILDRATEMKIGHEAWFNGAAARQAENSIAFMNWFMLNQSMDMAGGAVGVGIGKIGGAVFERWGSQIARNSLKGKAGEKLVEAAIRLKGYKIIGKHVTVKTSKGIRYVDYIVQKEGKAFAIEVKTGGAARSADQLAKDAALASEGGTIGNNGGALEGQTLKIKTVEVHPF